MPKPAFQFVDNIRCLAMISIVVEHSFFLGNYAYTASSSPYWFYLSGLQLVKFGTISFFIIAGFLFAENSGKYPFFEYLKRRMDSILKPWLVWALGFLLLLVGGVVTQALLDGVPLNLIKSGVWWGVKAVFLNSNYWFIINFFFCTTVLLLSKEVMNSMKFGLALLACTIFYSVNIYTEWITPLHTTAIGGFVFFYWLGIQLNIHKVRVGKLLKKIPVSAILMFLGVTTFVGVMEADLLTRLNKVDPINTLRLSNILFSLTVFVLLYKIRNFSWLNFLEPRKTTYGIFLIHYILVYFLLPLIMGSIADNHIQDFSSAALFKFQVTRFILVYVISLLMVRIIAGSKYSWLVGIRKARKNVSEPALIPVNPSERNVTLETEAA